VLSEFEALLVAVASDLLAARPGLEVAQAGGAPSPLGAGAGLVQIGVTAAAPDGPRGFSPGDRLPPVTEPHQVRVVPLHVDVTATLSRRAPAADDAALREARRLLLEDVTLLVHALDDPKVRDGASLRGATADPGFRVGEFALAGVTVAPTPVGDQQAATITYAGRLLVWPPGEAEEIGTVAAVDPIIEALPLTLAAEPARVPVGGTARVRIRGVTGTRLVDPDTGARSPARLAVGVASQLPPADRGAVTTGTAAAVAGFRIVPLIEPETVVEYAAPAGPLGTVRLEEVVVHLAVTGESGETVGVRLGSVALPLLAGP